MKLVIEQRDPQVPLSRACDALCLNRSTVYTRKTPVTVDPVQRATNRSRKHCVQPRALSQAEKDSVRSTLYCPEFVDQTAAEIYHTLLERGQMLCSPSTMYRIMRGDAANGERRAQRSPQSHAVPRLYADKPNVVWTWDCSKLATEDKHVYLTLYVVLDLFSRYVLGWMVSAKENSKLAKQLMDECSARYSIQPDSLTIHQDRGSPMIAHRYIDQMNELGITLSHSRPRVSNDNPFSESQFKTMKYQPDYPGRFQSCAHAREWRFEAYFSWYNFDHHHVGLNGYTPEQVFTGRYQEVAQNKQLAMDKRYELNPERFVAGRPTVKLPPCEVYINRITQDEIDKGAVDQVNFPTLSRVKNKLKAANNEKQ